MASWVIHYLKVSLENNKKDTIFAKICRDSVLCVI